MIVAFNGLLAYAKWAHQNQKMDGIIESSLKGKA
jgi:hypothetical protein